MNPRRNVFKFSFALLVFLFVAAATLARAQTAANETGVRLDLDAAEGAVTVENPRGGINVEVWNEDAVFVGASQGRIKTDTFPARIERTAGGFRVTVAAAGDADAPPIDLNVRVPARARLELVTSKGDVRVQGATQRLSARTTAGDVKVELPAASLDADITARSEHGATLSVLNGANVTLTKGSAFVARYGKGESKIELNSETGRIMLMPLDGAIANETNAAAPITSENANGAGKDEARAATNRASNDAATSRSASGERAKVETNGAPGAAPNEMANPNREKNAPAVASAPSAAPDSSAADAAPNSDSTLAAPTPAKPPKLIGAKGEAKRARIAGADAPEEVDENEVVRVDNDLVTLNFSVVNRESNRGVTNLKKEDFKLYEDGVEQEVVSFESASAPFDLVLLIDLSGSTTKVTNLVRAAALRFVEVSRPQDRISIITFASDIKTVAPLTSDRDALRAAISAMQAPKGDTKLYDAIATTLKNLSESSKDPSRRRAVVVISDGLDSVLPNVTGEGSKTNYDDLKHAVQEYDGQMYTLWLNTEYEAFSDQDIQPETFDLAHDRMEQLAEAGGGVFYEVEKYEDLAGTCERVIEDLGTVYNLAYRPTNKARDGSWRAVRVALPERPHAVARGKLGYYAKKEAK